MTTAKTMKVMVVLNTGGQVAAASKHVVSDHGKGSGDLEVTSGLVAGLGQTLVEIEVPSAVGALEGAEFLEQLASHASVKAAAENLPGMQMVAAAAQSGEAVSGTL